MAHHLATPLLQCLSSSGFPAAVYKPWSLDTIRYAIYKGPHTSTRNPASAAFCRADLADRVYRGFSLLVTAETAVLLFGRRLRISHLSRAPHTNRKDRLICDSTAPPPPVVTFSFPFRDRTHLLPTCQLTGYWHHRLCSSALAPPVSYNISGSLILSMARYTYRSGTSVTPFTAFLYALPILGPFPTLFRHSPAIQLPTCVCILSSL